MTNEELKRLKEACVEPVDPETVLKLIARIEELEGTERALKQQEETLQQRNTELCQRLAKLEAFVEAYGARYSPGHDEELDYSALDDALMEARKALDEET